MPFKKGQSGNPGGAKKGIKIKKDSLARVLLNNLEEDFAKYGVIAIQEMREKNPGDYVKMIAQFIPKEIEVTNKLGDLTEEQLADIATALDKMLMEQSTIAQHESDRANSTIN